MYPTVSGVDGRMDNHHFVVLEYCHYDVPLKLIRVFKTTQGEYTSV